MNLNPLNWIKDVTKFGYDAVVTSSRRRAPISDVKSEDDHLNEAQRRKLLSTTRDIRRNCSLAAWAIRKHLDYVASHNFQSRTGITALDTSIEKLVKWWSLPQNFDVAGRHGLRRFIRLAEAGRVVDGDMLVYKLNMGLVQAIEGDRVCNILGSLPSSYKIKDFKRGVKCSKNGKAQAYIINNRSKTGVRLTFNRVISARHILHFAYWDRFDQIRGISPLASAVTTFQDTYEGISYALARAKISQLFALLLNRSSGDAAGEVSGGENTEGEEDKSEYEVDFGKGPFVLDFDPEDKASFLESQQPAQEFQAFMELVMALALKALDIPYSFYNEHFTNYSGAREALLMYEQSAREKRKDVQGLLNSLTSWRLNLWVLDGVLELPGSMKVSDIEWEWQGSGIPWIDPLKETMADVRAVENGLNSRQRVMRRTGTDFWEVINELDAENKAIKERGLEKVAPTRSTGARPN